MVIEYCCHSEPLQGRGDLLYEWVKSMKEFWKALGAFSFVILFLFLLFFLYLGEFFPKIVPDFVHVISLFVALVVMIALLLWLRKERKNKKR